MKNSIRKSIENIGCFLLILMIIFPNVLQIPKALLLGIVIVGIVIMKRKHMINATHIGWISAYVFTNLFYIFYGAALSNPAPLKYFPVYVLWPLVFFFLAQNITYRVLYCFFEIFTGCLAFINITGIVAFILFNFVGFDSFLVFLPLIKPGFPFVAISGPIVTSFIFLFFFNLTLVLISKRKTKLEIINVILGIIFILLTCRRVLFLNIAIGIFVISFFSFMSGTYKKIVLAKVLKFTIGALILFFLTFSLAISYADFSFSDFLNLVINAFGDGDINDPRVDQSLALFNGWLEHPILGNGTGVDAKVSRSELPGTYELSYHAMLFERGILGCLIYFILYTKLNMWCLQSMKYSILDDKYTIAYLVALTLFMMANATNPYLNAFDYLWILFLGFAFCNKKFSVSKI